MDSHAHWREPLNGPKYLLHNIPIRLFLITRTWSHWVRHLYTPTWAVSTCRKMAKGPDSLAHPWPEYVAASTGGCETLRRLRRVDVYTCWRDWDCPGWNLLDDFC